MPSSIIGLFWLDHLGQPATFYSVQVTGEVDKSMMIVQVAHGSEKILHFGRASVDRVIRWRRPHAPYLRHRSLCEVVDDDQSYDWVADQIIEALIQFWKKRVVWRTAAREADRGRLAKERWERGCWYVPLSSSNIRPTSVAFFNIKRSSIACTYGYILQSPRLYIIPFSSARNRSFSQPVHVMSSIILIPLNKAAHTAKVILTKRE